MMETLFTIHGNVSHLFLVRDETDWFTVNSIDWIRVTHRTNDLYFLPEYLPSSMPPFLVQTHHQPVRHLLNRLSATGVSSLRHLSFCPSSPSAQKDTSIQDANHLNELCNEVMKNECCLSNQVCFSVSWESITKSFLWLIQYHLLFFPFNSFLLL